MNKSQISIFFSFLTLPLLIGCGGGKKHTFANDPNNESTPDESIPYVRAVKVERIDLTRTIEMPGHVVGYHTAELYAKVGGYLSKMHVDIGDKVKKDQPLAELHIPEMQKLHHVKEAHVEQAEAQVLQAQASVTETLAEAESAQALLKEAKSAEAEKKAQVKYAQTLRDRMKTLVDGGGARREKLDEAQLMLDKAESAMDTVAAQIRTAEAKVNAVEAKMEKSLADVIAATASLTAAERELEEHATMMAYATITAPFDGVITKRMLDPGAFVQPAERNSAAKPLLSITQSNRLRIFVNVPMAETQWLKNTLTATLKIESMSQEFKAFVIRFSPQLDRSTRTMLVELSLDDPTTPEDESQPKEGTRIYPGSYVQAKLNLVNYPNTPTIPASALLTDDEGKFVYKVVNNRIEKQTVTTIYEDGEQVGIESGLNGGEVIIETGGGQLAPGQQVKTNS